MKPLASFDIEIYKEIDKDHSVESILPVGITCAAIKLEGVKKILFYFGFPYMNKQQCINMLNDLIQINKFYTFLTWAGTGFDFKVLAYETEDFDRCGFLALNHIDMMLEIVFRKGWFVALDSALKGMNIKSKLHKIILDNGNKSKMSGKQAPNFWKQGEYSAVLHYLKYDVIRPLQLAKKIQQIQALQWLSKKGKPQNISIEYLRIVKDLFTIPIPDTSWMTDPPKRSQFIDWIPNYKQKIGF
jgi:hypothetical protein